MQISEDGTHLFCILITLVHFLTNNPLEGEVGSGLKSSLSDEGQISDQVVRQQRGGYKYQIGGFVL